MEDTRRNAMVHRSWLPVSTSSIMGKVDCMVHFLHGNRRDTMGTEEGKETNGFNGLVFFSTTDIFLRQRIKTN